MSKIEKKFQEDFIKTFGKKANFEQIKSQINYDKLTKPQKLFDLHFFKGFATGFATVFVIVLVIFLFNIEPNKSSNNSYVSLTAYNKVLTSIDEEAAEEVFLNFVERDPIYSSDSDVLYVSNYYIVIYFNNSGSSWADYTGDSSIDESNILTYLKLESLSKYITLDEGSGKVFIKFDNVSKIIVSKYMPEIFDLVETNGVWKIEFSIQLDPKVGVANA